jgi:uncharacterized membrane-anchored protein
MRVLSVFVSASAALLVASAAFADGPDRQLSRTETKKAVGVTQTSNLGGGGGGAVRLDLIKGYVYIPPQDVPPLLRTLDARAPAGQQMGAVAPVGKKVGAADYWVSVITYDAVGNVPETGADELGSLNFIDSVKLARAPEPALQSFAATPSYDYSGKTLTWGEQYDARNRNAASLRYETRVLGRAGVVGITTIARPAQLEKVRTEARTVRSMVTFNAGQRYADFISSSDRVSQYNLPGLIDGKARVTAAPPAPPPAAAAEPFAIADILPGGKQGWVSYVGGGLALLLGIGAVASMFKGGGGSRRRGPEA